MMQRLVQMLRSNGNAADETITQPSSSSSSEKGEEAVAVRRRRHPYLWTEEPVHLAGILTVPIIKRDEFDVKRTVGMRVEGIHSQKSVVFGHVKYLKIPRAVQSSGLGLDVESFEKLWLEEVNFALQPPDPQEDSSSVDKGQQEQQQHHRQNVLFLVDTVSHMHERSSIFFSSLEQLLTLPTNNNIAVIATLKPGIFLNYASNHFTACELTKSNRDFFVEKIVLPWLRPKFQSQLQKKYDASVYTEDENPAELNKCRTKHYRQLRKWQLSK